MRLRPAIVLGFLLPGLSAAATPPAQINYQGVLRSASDAPLTGAYDMVFSFWDAASGGNEILDDSHTGASGGAVSVSNGLFNVALGSGAVTDGPGPGTYTALDQVFRDSGTVWLQVKVGAETLNPRTQISAAAYALNATNLNGLPSSAFLDTTANAQTKAGGLTLNAPYPGTALTATGSLGASLSSNGSVVYLADGTWGIEAWGTTAGYFNGSSRGGYFSGSNSYAYVADGTNSTGVNAVGSTYGVWGSSGYDAGLFTNSADGSLAKLGFADVGVEGFGHFLGGYFQDLDTGGAYADLGYGGYIVTGNGTKAFRQNHPYDPGRVVVYNSLEGNEVGTYTRGSAKLVNGEARIALDPTYAWTTNPDIGLTATVTPRGAFAALYVASVTTKELVVRGPAGSSAEFDYLVSGLRIGFENLPIVQTKEQESPVPSMAAYETEYAAHPDLRAFNAMERFKGMKPRATSRDLSASSALLAAVNAQTPPGATAGMPKSGLPLPAAAVPSAAPHSAGPSIAPESPTVAPPLQPGVAVVHVADNVQPGDVVVADPTAGDALRLAGKAADPLLAGVVVAPAEGTRLGAGEALLAYAGTIVPCRVDADLGAIHAGDLLTSSSTPGHAMRAADATPGTILGKALQDLDRGAGTIRVLVMAR